MPIDLLFVGCRACWFTVRWMQCLLIYSLHAMPKFCNFAKFCKSLYFCTFEFLQFCNFAILQFCNSAILQFCGFEFLQIFANFCIFGLGYQLETFISQRIHWTVFNDFRGVGKVSLSAFQRRKNHWKKRTDIRCVVNVFSWCLKPIKRQHLYLHNHNNNAFWRFYYYWVCSGHQLKTSISQQILIRFRWFARRWKGTTLSFSTPKKSSKNNQYS